MTHNRRVITFINLAHVADHMFMLIFPTAVIGMTSAFDMSYGALLTLSLGGFIAFGAGSIPAGWLGDLWSRRNMMAVFFIGIGAAAIATGFAQGTTMIAVCLTGIGLFASIYHPVGTAMLTAHAERLGREIGINGVFGNLGVAFAALITGAITQYLGWRWAFILPGAVAVVTGLLFLMLVPDRPAPAIRSRGATGSIPRGVMVRAFAVLAMVTIAGGLVFNATTIAMPQLFTERLADLVSTPMGIGALTALVFVAGATSQLIVGRLIDRYTLRQVFLPLAALQAPCLLLAATTGGWTLIPLAVVMMFAIFGQVTINDGMVAHYTADRWRARAYAVRYLVSFAASACAVPLIAWTHDGGTGFAGLFPVLAAFGGIVFVGAAIFPGRPRGQTVPAAAE
ncbi:MFS transporter [Tistrella bauzanensis]|uniref:MFS transporter n=1 Tax=Tistrella bauzanensis TaxID=657419 RepID=A0ABQ1I9D9_9PROT|nr:MFS transporter [Tistrella bauzanensis]GGB26526.1 MFS transporter [Tistrella bauzanensis]